MEKIRLMGSGLWMSAVPALLCLGGCAEAERTVEWEQPYIVVEPTTTRAIQGVYKVDRRRYFSISDPAIGFENRVKDDEMFRYLADELDISFGRALALVKYPAQSMEEDPGRPGYADLSSLLRKRVVKPSDKMLRSFGPNFDVAVHGAQNAFPEYMGRFTTPEASQDPNHPQYLPQNIEAAAELSAAILKFNYSNNDRPRYYELVNEPHWSFFDEQHLADWHLVTMKKVHETTREVKVGGLCMSVCYFYRNNYKSFGGLKQFIDMTEGQMDFYSFHTYDYLRWRDGEFKGRLQSGLPLEGTLDLVPNYTYNTFGKACAMVISEQGGYNGEKPKGDFDGEFVAAGILSNHYPNADFDSWDFEMKKRSIVSFGHVSSIIANTMAFIDHPHTVIKAVPFILLNTWDWGPKYYAQMYVPKNYTDKDEWVEQDTLAFYRFFRGVNGRRVKALCSDPDLQTRAFVDGNKLYLAVNNLSFKPEEISLYGMAAKNVQIRRLGRNEDFTLRYEEGEIPTPKTLTIAGRESVMLVAEFKKPVPSRNGVNEVVCYADQTAVPVGDADFKITVPLDKPIDYAQLRIAITRAPGMEMTPEVKLNGKTLGVPLEDSAERYVDREYASTKLIYIDPQDLKAKNTVSVRFPDGDNGAVGSVVIRAAQSL